MKINKEENVLITGYNGGPVNGKANFKIITQEEANEKLHKILNIEEEIGLDLTIIFSALKNGVWYFDEQGQLLHDYVWLVNNYVGTGVPDKLSFSFKTFLSGKILLFAGYGKEWALTEERLHENCIINIYALLIYMIIVFVIWS